MDTLTPKPENKLTSLAQTVLSNGTSSAQNENSPPQQPKTNGKHHLNGKSNFDHDEEYIAASSVKNYIREAIDDFKDELMSENYKFKAEIFKEFISLRV